MLACPRCGGSVPPTDHDCQYCGTALLVRACPRCFARIFHEAQHCSNCGASAVVPARTGADGAAERLRCPRCATDLVGRLIDEVLIDECTGCHGVWVNMTALERVIEERRQARAEQILGSLAPAETSAQPAGGAMYIRCPECDVVMNRRMFARGSGIIVNVCRNHGTWFDGGELPAVIQFVMKGGLEAAARKDAESLREEARRERQRARATAAAAATSLPLHHRDRAGTLGSLLGVVVRVLSEDI